MEVPGAVRSWWHPRWDSAEKGVPIFPLNLKVLTRMADPFTSVWWDGWRAGKGRKLYQQRTKSLSKGQPSGLLVMWRGSHGPWTDVTTLPGCKGQQANIITEVWGGKLEPLCEDSGCREEPGDSLGWIVAPAGMVVAGSTWGPVWRADSELLWLCVLRACTLSKPGL